MWFIATRNRPQAMQDVIAAFEKYEMPEVAVIQDGCVYDIEWPSGWHVFSSSVHRELTASVNALFEEFPNEVSYGLLTDHNFPCAEGWWRKLDVNAGKDGMVCPASRYPAIHPDRKWRRLTAGLCIGGDLARRLGWLLPPTTIHFFADDILEAIGHGANRLKFLDEYLIQDKRLSHGEVPRDDNHDRLLNGAYYWPKDKAACDKFMAEELPGILERLNA